MLKDSGTRRSFVSGAVRDAEIGKGRCDLLPLDILANNLEDSILSNIYQYTQYKAPSYLQKALTAFIDQEEKPFKNAPDMYLEVAKHFEEGAVKYGERNWEKGIPVDCYIDSAVRHYLKWLRGDMDERHDRAFAWNIICLMWTRVHLIAEEVDD